jgi:hypothetical protein
MDYRQRIRGILTWLGIALLQVISTQVVTFLVSLLFPGMENSPQTRPVLFVILLGISFTLGAFITGWLAIKLRWLNIDPKLPARAVTTLIGAYLPLILALIIYHTLAPGNPFFLVSALASVLGFHLPGWIKQHPSR